MKQKKRAVTNAVQASDNCSIRERTRQSPSSISSMRGRGSKLNPAVTIIAQWREAEPTPALKNLLRLLLSPPQKGGQI